MKWQSQILIFSEFEVFKFDFEFSEADNVFDTKCITVTQTYRLYSHQTV